MRRLLAITLFVVLGTGSALASAYDDFSRGVDANNHGDADVAITSFTRAIADGGLASPYLPSAYLGRARAYLEKRLCVNAYPDLDSAIRLRPDYVDAYRLRASAAKCLNRPDSALSDATMAIDLRPAAGYYFARARLQWDRGSYSQAQADAIVATQRAPQNPYYLLWLAVIGDRTGTLDQDAFIERVAGFDKNAWPTPLLNLFIGRIGPDEVYRAAARGNGQTPTNQKCEADFYIGQWQLARGNAAVARNLLQTAANECPKTYIAFDAAQAELARLR